MKRAVITSLNVKLMDTLMLTAIASDKGWTDCFYGNTGTFKVHRIHALLNLHRPSFQCIQDNTSKSSFQTTRAGCSEFCLLLHVFASELKLYELCGINRNSLNVGQSP